MGGDSESYFHGTSPAEHDRLVTQAAYWRDRLLLVDLDYAAGDRILEIGCAAGAALAELGAAFPDTCLHGVDRDHAQVRAARRHLDARGFADAAVVRADGAALPFATGSFDHVFVMWLLEHVVDPEPILAEALRVLRPGGTITLTETDYDGYHVWPPNADWTELDAVQRAHYEANGQACAGRRLGPWLAAAGFAGVRSRIVGFHFHAGDAEQRSALGAHADYIADFLEPAVAMLATSAGVARDRLQRGVEHLRRLSGRDDAALTHVVYRARAIRPHA